MKISVLQLGQLGTNCYIVQDEQTMRCAVIDPGDAGKELAAYIAEQGLTVGCILLTHGHYDHTGGLKALHAATNTPVYVHAADSDNETNMSRGNLIFTDTYADGDCVTVDSLQFQVLSTPGHTPGSVSLLCADALFSGDTLFAGSCGRTDFPGGSQEEMRLSLKRLGSLEGEVQVYPGHGESSTLGYERQHNPYLREAMRR